MKAAWRLSAAELGAAYRRRETDPLAVFDALSDRIGRINPSLTAVVELQPHARVAARRSAERFERGEPLGPLDGVPVTVKDNILVAGMHCRWGSRLYADYVPAQDELPIARLRAAGAVIVGKTNVPEFTLEGYTTNQLFGTTRNPWDTRLTPGPSWRTMRIRVALAGEQCESARSAPECPSAALSPFADAECTTFSTA